MRCQLAASNAQPFEINNFSGGITDHVFDQTQNRAAELDNFLINGDGRPSTRYGSILDDDANAEVPTGQRVGHLLNYANNDKLFYQSNRFLYYRNPSAFTELTGPGGGSVFSEGTLTNVASFAQWNRHVYTTNDAFSKPMKIYKDVNGVYQLRSSGLPALASDPIITAGAPGDNTYIYGFYYSYSYTVFDLTYEMLGPVTLVTLADAEAPDIAPVSISSMPVLVNGVGDNYDVSNIQLNIFRTTTGETFLQSLAQVSNGTTNYVDNTSDEDLQASGVALYTNDGTLDFDPPPLHKFNHVVNNTGYFAFIRDEFGDSPYKIRQSIPGVPDTAPIDFELSVDDEISGLSSVRNMPIILCKKYVFRIDNFFDQFGRGNPLTIRISDTAGCISNNSCVQAENGLFWFGNDGVYYTDGYQVQKISGDNNEFYKDILRNTTQATRVIGRFYEKERLIIWSIQTDSANQDNDSFLILDLKWGISENCTFTTWSGASFRPSAIEIFNQEIYRGDIRGFIFKHQQNLTTDKKINIYIQPNTWVDETIIWNITTINYNFGSSFFRKYPTRVMLTASDSGNTTIQINAINDAGKSIRACKPIRIRRNLVWGDDDFVWRVTDLVWRGSGFIEQWRRFPANSLRLSYLQLEITNGFSDITNSDTLGEANFDSVAKTATLSGVFQWPEESEDYFIYLENDNYTKGYLIAERTSDTVITLLDPLDELPATGDYKWVIRGFKKSEGLNLLGINIHWMNISQSQKAYDSSASSTGENA